MLNQEKPQDFELIELLIKEAAASTSTQQESDFESFKARFQSYIDQIPSYLHSVSKEGFFSHFFLGSFSTLMDTKIVEKLGIKKLYFSFDTSKTLKVAIIKKDDIKNQQDAIDKVSLFVISEPSSKSKKFSYGELERILGQLNLPAQAQYVRDAKDKLKVKLVEITKGTAGKKGISVEVKDNKLDKNVFTTHEFKEVKKGLWNKPENDIAKLTNSDKEEVKKSLKEILKKVGGIHSKYENSLIYGKEAREAAHHGFIAGAFMNFRYRYNLRVYLEQFAGRGYADIVLVPRGEKRALDAIPIIIEMKAATAGELKKGGKIKENSKTTPAAALKQAEDYTKGFQPNVMRVLTTADDILCVGVNLDHTFPISDIVAKQRNQEITPLFNEILGSFDERNKGEINEEKLKERIQNNMERIYHTFPGTGEKGDNHYFSRFLLGQSLLLNEVEALGTSFEKHVFIYGENIPTETRSEGRGRDVPQRTAATKADKNLAESTKLDESHAVVTMVFVPENDRKLVYVMNIVEADGRAEVLKKGISLNELEQKIGNRKIVELNLNFNVKEKSNFEKHFSIEVNEPISLEQYSNKKIDEFKGSFENVPYPKNFKKAFDEVLKSQLASPQDQFSSIGEYKELFGKVGEAMLPFKGLIKKEAHTQAVFHGVFSHYSDIKLGESQENRALVLPEFQTGRGKRIDMLIHGIKFADQASSAKEYDPVGLELKGPREGKNADALMEEANKQIHTEYEKGVTYKTLTDGDKVAFIGVVFNGQAEDSTSLIKSSEGFQEVEVKHSSILSFSQCATRKRRDIGIPCTDSRDEEKITGKEKERLIKELFSIEAYDKKVIIIDSPQVSIDNGKVYIKVKDNNGNDKELIIDSAANIKSIENYILDKENLEIKLKVSSDKEYVIIEEIKEQGSEYYLKIDDYRIKLDSIFEDGKEVIFDKLHQLSNNKQLLENKKYVEDIGSIEDIETDQDYNNVVEEIKQNLLAKGVREDTFDRFKSHFDDLGEKVFADYISNVESSLQEKGIEFDRNKFDSAKIKGAKGGKFFSMMAIYDLFDSIGDAATLGRHDNDALKQVFGINGILDAMDDVRTSLNISPNSKVGRLINKIPQPIRQAFIKIIDNPVVQSITFATIAYQFGYSVNEIAQGNNHPLNYYWTASSGIKLASMSIRPISAGVSFTIKSVSATTKILRGLSAAGKVLGRVAVVTMAADVLITIGVEIHERMEYTKAIAEQVPLLPGDEQAEVFFAKVIKFFTGRDVEKEYEDKIRIKGYLNHVKEVATQLLNDNYNIAAVVQYVISIEEKYSEIIKYTSPTCVQYAGCVWGCELEKKYDGISFSNVNTASNVKNDLSSLDISKVLTMAPYTLVMSEGWEKFICNIKSSPQCHQDIDKKKVYVVNTDAKHIPHLTKYEYENLGLRIVRVPLGYSVSKPQCGKVINEENKYGDIHRSCNTGKIHKGCQESFTLSGEPFIFTNPTRKNSNSKKEKMFPKGSVLYISGPRTLTAAANYPAVMHIPEGSNIRYIGSENNETIFIINDHTSGTLKGGVGKENTVVMNVKANNIVADLYSGTIRYGNSNNIRLVNTYNYVSNSDSKQNITTHCETRLINVKNAEVWQNSSNCTDKDYEVRVVNKENMHHRGLKQTIFFVNEDSDNARIVSDLGSTEKIKENVDTIRVQVANVTQWGISENIEKGSYSLDLLADDMQSIVSSTKVNDFKSLVIQVNCRGITESVAIQDKSLSDTVEDIRYQKLRNSGNDVNREVMQNSEKKLKAFIQASIPDQELPSTYQVAKNIDNNNNFDIPISQIEVTKNHMGIPAEKVIIAGMYSDQVIVDFSYNNSDVTSSYQKYRNNGGSYNYDDYMMLCNYYQDVTVEGREGQRQYIIKLPDTLNSEVSSSPIRLNLKIKNKAAPYQNIPYSIIDFAELNVMDVDSISIQEGKRSYINECYNESISDLTEDSLEIQDITMLDSKGTKWSLSIGLVDYFESLEHQQVVLRMNNELYKIDSTNSKLEHVEMDPNSFRYYQPDEQGLQIYHNQPINKNDVGLLDFRDKSILDFDTEIADDSLVLLHKNNTLAKVENWNTYQPAREMMFAFNDTIVANAKCIFSTCSSEDIIEDFNREKVTLLKEQMFDAIVRNSTNEAKDLIRKIESIDTESKHELTPLYVAIQAGRLDIVEILFERKHFSVKDKDIYGCNPLHWAAQQGNLNIAKFLVDKGADIGAKDNDGRTPLRVAAYSGNLDMVKFFLDRNMSIEVKNNDPYKMMGVVEGVKNEIINQADTAPNVKRWAEFFVEKLRYSIKSVAKEKLKDGMLRNRYSSVNELANEIYKSDGKLFDDIIKGVINDVYGRVDTRETLSYVRSHNNAGQRISGYVAVFDAMQRNDDLNNSAIFKLAYSIKEAMSFDKYSSLDSGRKSELERLKNKLPESVRNAVFSSKVCIKNIYQGEYLYAANKCFNYDSDRRMAFTWTPKNEKNDKFRWNIKPDGDNFNIVNAEFNENLYAASNYFNYDNDRRMVFTWVSGGQVTQGVWKIEPNGDKCNIRNVKHNEYLYAADYAKYDNDRRRVFTWIPGGQVSQGMWMIEDCGSTLRKVRNADASSNLRVSRQAQLDYALLNATKIGNISEVTGLVNQGANVNTEDRDGNTPSRNAVLKGHFGIFKYLFENGVSLEGKDHRCGPSICDASYSGNLDILKYLIGKGVDINESDNNGWTPLHFAAWRGYLEVANFLIEKGANINVENIFGRKPIHIAAENNNKNIIEFFLSKGMSIDDTDRDGRTSLYYASWNGHLDMVKHLIDKGADIYIQDKGGKISLDAAIDQKHDDIVKYLEQVQLDRELLIVAQYGNLNEVKDLVSQGASLGAKYSDGRTLMHCAAYGGKLDMVKYFIDEKKIDINTKDNDGWKPLYYASCGHHLDVIKYLDEKHNPNLKSSLQGSSALLETINSNNIEVQDELGRTPLHLAAKVGDWNKVKLLCDYNANIEAQDNFGYTPILFATQSGKLSVVSLVLYYGANINAQNMYGSTPLHYAAQEGNLDMIQFLLSRCARIELLDNSLYTPILSAAKFGKWSTVKLLIDRGAKFNNEMTYQGTPLHFAVQMGNLSMVQFLLDKGANIESQDSYNNKPLHLAVKVNRLDIVKFLLNKHANVNARNMEGGEPLELAIQNGYKDIEEVLKQTQLDLDKELLIVVKSGDLNLNKITSLINRGADVNIQGSNGWTPLHWAASEGCFVIVEYLIGNNANIDAKNNIGRTSLHNAARNGHLDVVKYLIEKDADFEVKDKDDKTPLDLASWKKHNDVVKYLEKIKEERNKPVQRRRRHHHGDHNRHQNHLSRKPLAIDSSNQPKIAVSSGIRPSSWINDLFSWVKSSVGRLLSSKSEGTASSVSQVDGQFAKASVSNSSLTSTTLPSDGTDKRQENGGFFRDNVDYVNANLKRMRERQTPVKFKPSGGNTILEMGDHYLSQVDFNGTIMLFDLLIRRVTGQKYISTADQSISPLEAQGYALNITKGFEKVVEQAGLKSGVSMHRLNIDYTGMQKEITRRVMSGEFDEVSGVLKLYIKKACPCEEAGKLSPKKFDKFMVQFNSRLNVVLNQPVQQMLHNGNGILEVDSVKKQQMSLEPQSYLSNASIQSYSKDKVSTCLSDVGVTKLGNTLSK